MPIASRGRARVEDVLAGAAGPLPLDRRAVIVELQGDAHDVVARPLEQGRGDGRIRRRRTSPPPPARRWQAGARRGDRRDVVGREQVGEHALGSKEPSRGGLCRREHGNWRDGGRPSGDQTPVEVENGARRLIYPFGDDMSRQGPRRRQGEGQFVREPEPIPRGCADAGRTRHRSSRLRSQQERHGARNHSRRDEGRTGAVHPRADAPQRGGSQLDRPADVSSAARRCRRPSIRSSSTPTPSSGWRAGMGATSAGSAPRSITWRGPIRRGRPAISG